MKTKSIIELSPEQLWTAATIGARRNFLRIQRLETDLDEPYGWEARIMEAAAEIACMGLLGWKDPRFDDQGERLNNSEDHGVFVEVRCLPVDDGFGERRDLDLKIHASDKWKLHRPFVVMNPHGSTRFSSAGFVFGTEMATRGEGSHIRDLGGWHFWSCAQSKLRPLSDLVKEIENPTLLGKPIKWVKDLP